MALSEHAPNNGANFSGMTTPVLVADNIQTVSGNPASTDGIASLSTAGGSPAAIAFEVQSTTGGTVFPRMTLQERDAQAGFWLNGTVIYVTVDISTRPVTQIQEFQFFENGIWIPLPTAGIGDVTFVPPVPTAVGNIPVFNDLTGLFIKDSTVNIAGGVSTLTPNTSPVVGNQFSNLSILEFITATRNANDCWLSVERADTVDTVFLARLFRNDNTITPTPFASMIFSNCVTGVTPSTSNSILELQCPNGPGVVFVNSRVTQTQRSTAPWPYPVDGSQYYLSTNDNQGRVPRMIFNQRGLEQWFNPGYGAQCWGQAIVTSAGGPVTYTVDSTIDCVVTCTVGAGNVIQINLPFDPNAQGGVYVVQNIGAVGGGNIIQIYVGGKVGGGPVGTSSNGFINGLNTPALISAGYSSLTFYCRLAAIGTAYYHIIASTTSGQTLSLRDVTGLRTVPVFASDYVVNITDTSVGATAVQLPPAAVAGESFVVKDGGGSAGINAITVSIISGGGTIDGAATAVINTNYGSLTFVSDGTNYYVI